MRAARRAGAAQLGDALVEDGEGLGGHGRARLLQELVDEGDKAGAAPSRVSRKMAKGEERQQQVEGKAGRIGHHVVIEEAV